MDIILVMNMWRMRLWDINKKTREIIINHLIFPGLFAYSLLFNGGFAAYFNQFLIILFL